jgi:hypothetical protein
MPDPRKLLCTNANPNARFLNSHCLRCLCPLFSTPNTPLNAASPLRYKYTNPIINSCILFRFLVLNAFDYKEQVAAKVINSAPSSSHTYLHHHLHIQHLHQKLQREISKGTMALKFRRPALPIQGLIPLLVVNLFIINLGLSIASYPATKLMQDIICKHHLGLTFDDLLPESQCHDRAVQRELNIVAIGAAVSATIAGVSCSPFFLLYADMMFLTLAA